MFVLRLLEGFVGLNVIWTVLAAPATNVTVDVAHTLAPFFAVMMSEPEA